MSYLKTCQIRGGWLIQRYSGRLMDLSDLDISAVLPTHLACACSACRLICRSCDLYMLSLPIKVYIFGSKMPYPISYHLYHHWTQIHRFPHKFFLSLFHHAVRNSLEMSQLPWKPQPCYLCPVSLLPPPQMRRLPPHCRRKAAKQLPVELILVWRSFYTASSLSLPRDLLSHICKFARSLRSLRSSKLQRAD